MVGWLLGCGVIIVITLPVISGPGLASASPAQHTGGASLAQINNIFIAESF